LIVCRRGEFLSASANTRIEYHAPGRANGIVSLLSECVFCECLSLSLCVSVYVYVSMCWTRWSVRGTRGETHSDRDEPVMSTSSELGVDEWKRDI